MALLSRHALAASSAPLINIHLPPISTPTSSTFIKPTTTTTTSTTAYLSSFTTSACTSSLQAAAGDAAPLILSTSSQQQETNLGGSFNKLVESLEKVKLLDLSGNEVRLTKLWEDRVAVIGFARHFGCILCRKRADVLASRKNEMDAAGVSLALIGPGNVDQANVFMQQTNFPGELYADPSHAAYEALEFVSGLSSIFTPKAAWSLVTAHMEGYRQDWALSSQKHTVRRGGWQQGGVLVAGPGVDRIIYLHKDKEAGDDPNIHDVLAACCKP